MDIILELFVTGRTSRSRTAIENLHQLCATELPNVDLTLIDVLERPDLAEQARILATPTLIKIAPAPICRIVGDLSQMEKVLRLLKQADPA